MSIKNWFYEAVRAWAESFVISSDVLEACVGMSWYVNFVYGINRVANVWKAIQYIKYLNWSTINVGQLEKLRKLMLFGQLSGNFWLYVIFIEGGIRRNGKLTALNDVIAKALDDIETQEENVEILDAGGNDV
nr:hypothetical protein [Tanacetum cinerariifolium]